MCAFKEHQIGNSSLPTMIFFKFLPLLLSHVYPRDVLEAFHIHARIKLDSVPVLFSISFLSQPYIYTYILQIDLASPFLLGPAFLYLSKIYRERIAFSFHEEKWSVREGKREKGA